MRATLKFSDEERLIVHALLDGNDETAIVKVMGMPRAAVRGIAADVADKLHGYANGT